MLILLKINLSSSTPSFPISEVFAFVPNINKSLLDDFECLIVGESYEKLSNYKSIINEDVINKITWITKYVSDKEASLYFSASDFIILPCISFLV